MNRVLSWVLEGCRSFPKTSHRGWEGDSISSVVSVSTIPSYGTKLKPTRGMGVSLSSLLVQTRDYKGVGYLCVRRGGVMGRKIKHTPIYFSEAK